LFIPTTNENNEMNLSVMVFLHFEAEKSLLALISKLAGTSHVLFGSPHLKREDTTLTGSQAQDLSHQC